MRNQSNRTFAYYLFAGKRYWSASFLPALIGTTLPFWLCPPDFKFKLPEAILFAVLILLGHFGFSMLYFGFTQKFTPRSKRKPLFILGTLSIITSTLIGLYINTKLRFHPNVPDYIFIIYGVSAIFVGVLYVVPPFKFHQRLYGEIIISVGLGMMPIIGAYLVQVGDITRTVYLASLPIVISTGLWIWIKELINKEEDKRNGYKTTVMYFHHKFSSRIITLFLTLLIYASLLLAVFGRSSLNPLSLIALLSLIFALMMIKKVWKGYDNIKVLENAEKYAFLIHLSTSVVIILASLSAILTSG